MKKNVIIIISGLALLLLAIIIVSTLYLFRLPRQTLRYKDQVFSVEFSNDATTFTDPASGLNYLTSKKLNMGIGINNSTSQKDCGQSGSKTYQQINVSGNLYSLCAGTNTETGKPAFWTVNFAINSRWYSATLIPNSTDTIISQKQAAEIFSSIQMSN